MLPIAHIPKRDIPRVVIIGGGFAGLTLALALRGKPVQIVLLDQNNYHQFQPLFYQVATAGLEPSSIVFPLRKILQKQKYTHFRTAKITHIQAEQKVIETTIGSLEYDQLVIATGANTNFFGMADIAKNAVPMKSITEAIHIRNTILENYESALATANKRESAALLRMVIVGGGPTGVELAGAFAEMKKYVLPKDYPDLDFSQMTIHIYEASARLLGGMSEEASNKALLYLRRLGVEVRLEAHVKSYDGSQLTLASGETLSTKTLIWAAGIQGNSLAGLDKAKLERGGRYAVDDVNQIKGYSDIFAIGDVAQMNCDAYPKGHPQVAQVAIQQARQLAKNIVNSSRSAALKPFVYKDKGSLATIGRHLAVADLPKLKFQGFLAWVLWLFVHLMSLLGAKNKVFVFLNWAWSYLSYDQSLRLIIKNKPETD
jgi:NADH dehydrogenase